MLETLAELYEKAVMVFSIIGIVLALLQCFLGFKLIKFWIGLIGFIAGFGIGTAIAANIPDAAAFLPVVIGLAAGIILALLAYKLYLVGVFIYCGLLAYGAVKLLPFPDSGGWKVLAAILAVLAFILAGALAVKFSRPCIILITAVSGASTASGLMQKVSDSLAANPGRASVIFLVLAVLGILIQFVTTREKKK